MKLIPAGTSKRTGKPYKAFYACPDKICGATTNAPQSPQEPVRTPDIKPVYSVVNLDAIYEKLCAIETKVNEIQSDLMTRP